MKKLLKSKKVLVAAAMATIMAISGGAYAWFSYTAVVDGGNIAMDILEVSASDLKVYGLAPQLGGDYEYEVTGDVEDLKMMPSQSAVVGYTVTIPKSQAGVIVALPGISDFTSIDFRVNLDAMKNDGSPNNDNPVWLDKANPTVVRNESFGRVTDPALKEWFGDSTITSKPLLDELDVQGAELFVSPVDGRVFVSTFDDTPELTFDVLFDITFSKNIDNRYQAATFKFDGFKVQATQIDIDWEAANTIFGVDIEAGFAAANDMIDADDFAYVSGDDMPIFSLPNQAAELALFYAAN